MTKEQVAKKIYELSHITGEFLLRSGQISNEYFDKYLFEANPEVLAEIAKIMSGMIPEGTDVIAGLEMGGIPVVTAISLNTVVTTGGAIIDGVKELRKKGAIVDTVLCVIQRADKATDILAAEGLKLIPAFTMDYIKAQV